MNIVRIVKIPYLIICCLLLVILWLLSHQHHHHHHHNHPSYDPIITIQPESSNLLNLLRRVTMDDRTVIVTIVDKEWAKPGSILDLFLESVRIGERTKHLLNHLIVAALDDEAFEYCLVVHQHCYLHKDYKRKTDESLNPDGLVNGWKKKELLTKILSFGYNIMFTEADVLWLKNPLTLCHSSHSMSLACEFSSRDHQYIAAENTGGFFYVQSNDVTVDLFRILNIERFVYPATQNQSICNIVKRRDVIQGMNMKLTYIDEANFGRFCQKNRLEPSKISTVHASCCKDTDKKVHYLKLILQDLKNMTRDVQDSFSPWRIPSQC